MGSCPDTDIDPGKFNRDTTKILQTPFPPPPPFKAIKNDWSIICLIWFVLSLSIFFIFLQNSFRWFLAVEAIETYPRSPSLVVNTQHSMSGTAFVAVEVNCSRSSGFRIVI